MTSIIWTYQQVKTWRSWTGSCPVCGRRVRRARTFAHTVSPFHPAVTLGMDLRAAERAVRDAVQAEADAWVPDFTHAACAGCRLQDGEEAAA